MLHDIFHSSRKWYVTYSTSIEVQYYIMFCYHLPTNKIYFFVVSFLASSVPSATSIPDSSVSSGIVSFLLFLLIGIGVTSFTIGSEFTSFRFLFLPCFFWGVSSVSPDASPESSCLDFLFLFNCSFHHLKETPIEKCFRKSLHTLCASPIVSPFP